MLTSDGRIYSFGDAKDGNSNKKPVIMSQLMDVVVCNISSGSLHTTAIVEDPQTGKPNEVYAWGDQIESNKKLPRILKALSNKSVVSISSTALES